MRKEYPELPDLVDGGDDEFTKLAATSQTGDNYSGYLLGNIYET